MQPKVEAVTRRLGSMASLDAPARSLQRLSSRAIPEGSVLKDVLSGTWLGHPVHPPLTDVVVGGWTSALALDLLAPRAGRKSADRLVAIGILAAVPTAVTGLSDWAELGGAERRIGMVHAGGNAAALVLQMRSWWERKRGRRGRGVLLSLTAMGLATFTAWLGGHLAFRKGVGVNQTAFLDAPGEFTPLIGADELEEGKPVRAEAEGLAVLLYRRGSDIHAIADRCTHRGCSLSDGDVDGVTVTCACHGSVFRLADGGLVSGPASAPAPRFDVRVRNGKIEVRAAGR